MNVRAVDPNADIAPLLAGAQFSDDFGAVAMVGDVMDNRRIDEARDDACRIRLQREFHDLVIGVAPRPGRPIQPVHQLRLLVRLRIRFEIGYDRPILFAQGEDGALLLVRLLA